MMKTIQHPSESSVLVIGAASVDIVGTLKGDLTLATSNPSQIRTSYGGVARNVAENLARLGEPVRLVTALGLDHAGDQLLCKTEEAGVDMSMVLRVSDHPTGVYLAVVNQYGELQLALDDMRVISVLSPEYLQSHDMLFKEASMIFVDANLSKMTLQKAFSLARRAHAPICADSTSAALAFKLRPYLPKLFLITPNHIEAGILCGRTVDASKRRQAVEVAKILVSMGVEIAVITLAQFGVCYATSETSGYVPAIRTEIVDPTGGGDALTATVMFALLNGIPLDDAIRLGVSAATLALSNSGAVVPDLTLEKLYNQLVI